MAESTTPLAELSEEDAQYLRLLSTFHYVVAGMMALFASFPILHLVLGLGVIFGKFGKEGQGAPPPELVGWFFVVFAGAWILAGWTLAICLVLAARYLRQRRRYLFCLVVAAVSAATCMPFGTVLGVFTIIVLLRPSVKQAFRAPPTGG